MSDLPSIPTDQLKIGLYVHLDLRWFEHPFPFGHFKIKNEEQIKIIQGLGLKTIRYNPAQSDLAAPPTTAKLPPVAQEPSPYIAKALAAKRVMIERIKVQRAAAARIEHAFVNTAKTVREVEKNIYTNPAETVHQANQLVTQIADSILCAPELALHVMGDKTGGEELYFHSLNVTMLSMMVARDIKLPQEVVGTLGMGALFHDIGRKEIPNKILMKLEPLTQAEQHLYEMHCQYGVEIGKKLEFSAPVLKIIQEHHEFYDGSGYPRGIKGTDIPLFGRIVAVADVFDALTSERPYKKAWSLEDASMFLEEGRSSHFDPMCVESFLAGWDQVIEGRRRFQDEVAPQI